MRLPELEIYRSRYTRSVRDLAADTKRPGTSEHSSDTPRSPETAMPKPTEPEVVVPAQRPTLTADAARALLRIILKAADKRSGNRPKSGRARTRCGASPASAATDFRGRPTRPVVSDSAIEPRRGGPQSTIRLGVACADLREGDQAQVSVVTPRILVVRCAVNRPGESGDFDVPRFSRSWATGL